MTPFDAALSRLRDAAANSTCAVALSPASAALRTRRTAVFSADLTDLLRRRAASLVRMRLILDLILATPDCLRFVGGMVPDARAGPGAHDLRGYQLGWWLPKSAPSPAAATMVIGRTQILHDRDRPRPSNSRSVFTRRSGRSDPACRRSRARPPPRR